MTQEHLRPPKTNRDACPDGGTCHHWCTGVMSNGKGLPCFRVLAAEPFTNEFPDEPDGQWPKEIADAHRIAKTNEDGEQPERKHLTIEDMDRAESFTRGLLGMPKEEEPKIEAPVLRIEVWERRSGKTTSLVEWLKEETPEDRVVLVHTEHRATVMRNEHRLDRDRVMSHYDFANRTRGRRHLVVRVEDGNALFRHLLGAAFPKIGFEVIMVEDEQRGPEHG